MAFVAPARDFTDGTLVFSAGVDTRLPGHIPLPNRWREGARLWPRIHYLCTTPAAGTINFTFEYALAIPNGDYPADYTLVANTVSASGSTTKHATATFGFIDASTYTISAVLLWRLARLGTTDTYTGGVKLMVVTTTTEFDALGSVFRFVKT